MDHQRDPLVVPRPSPAIEYHVERRVESCSLRVRLGSHSLTRPLAAAALLGTLLHHLIAFAHALATLRARATDVRANATGELVAL
jgi:hypothetical protein